MKKILIALATICLILTGCSKPSATETVDVNLNDLMETIKSDESIELPMSMDLSKDEFIQAYGIDETLISEVVSSKAMISAQIAEIIMIKVADGVKTSDVLTKINEYYAAQMLYPSQAELVDQKVVIESGNYLFVVVAENADAIKAVIETALK